MIANFSQYHVAVANVFFSLVCFILVFLLRRDYIDETNLSYANLYFFICLVVFCFHFFVSFQYPNVKMLYELCFTYSFLCLKSYIRSSIVDKFVRILAFLLLLSLIEYFLYYLGIHYYWGKVERPGFGYPYYQGLFNLIPYYASGKIFRFHFITEEPGLIGTLCFFMIATLDRKKYKKECIVFIIAGVISFSLAFYLLVILWGVTKVKPSNFKYLLIPIALYAFFYESINDIIVDRVINGIEQGNLDNRNSRALDMYLLHLWDDGQLFFGVGNREFFSLDLGSTSGLKRFVAQYGIFGFLLCSISFSFVFLRYNKINYSSIILLSLFWISFYQRCDLNIGFNTILLFSHKIATDKNFIYLK